MTSYPGAQVSLAMKLGSTFGAAAALGAGDRLIVDSFTRNENVTPLLQTGIGSGDSMQSNGYRGKTAPGVSFSGNMGYNDPTIATFVQLFGAQSTMNMGSSVYSHSIYMNETGNQKFGTFGMVPLGGSAMEWASAACQKISLSVQDPSDFLKIATDWLANQEKLSGTTNSTATIEATTFSDNYPVVVESTDDLWINAASGAALSSSYRLPIQAIQIEYERPQEVVYEARGSAGNAAPVPSGSMPLMARITLTTKDLNDQEFFFWQNAASGTEYKAQFNVTDEAILGGSLTRKVIFYFPRLKLTGSPEYSPSSPGRNQFKITLDAFVAVTNPTGMIDRYPYVIVQNGKSTDY